MAKLAGEKFRSLLNAKRTELQNGLRRRDGIAIEKTADVLDEVYLASERELTTRSLERESKQLQDVRAALIRLDNHTYGICVECDGEISAKRLSAVPWTTRCISCQERTDRGLRTGYLQPAYFVDAA